MKCVFVGSLKDAKWFLWQLAITGIPTAVSQDGLIKNKWHVAVPLEYADSPGPWLISIRGADAPDVCNGDPALKHVRGSTSG